MSEDWDLDLDNSTPVSYTPPATVTDIHSNESQKSQSFSGGISVGKIGKGRGFNHLKQVLSNVGSTQNHYNGSANSGPQSDGRFDDFDSGATESYTYGSSDSNQWQPERSRGGRNNDSGSRGSSKGCFNCGKDGHIGRDCPDKNGAPRKRRTDSKGGSRSCFKCGEEGHMSRDCPQGDRRSNSKGCFKCGEDGHMSRDCPNESNNRSGGNKGCFKCGEDGHISRDCPNESNKRSGGNKGCFNCGEDGHMSRDCPNESNKRSGGNKGCFNCGEDGHMSRDCPNESNKRSGGNKGCFNCGEDGHMSRDCPNESNKKSGGNKGCFKCGEDGHMAKDCTNEEKTADGKPREAPYIPPEPAQDENTLFEGVPTGINFTKYDSIPVTVSGRGAPSPISSFEEANFRELLKKNIHRSKYEKPTPVQKYAIPIILAKRDLMACAQTGSGKTAAFLLPILQRMYEDPSLPNPTYQTCQEPWAVIISPTRELAIQICNEARKFSYDSIVKVKLIYGGTSVGHQSQRLQEGCHILVATPGRLLDFVEKGKVAFSQLKYLILDEADRMLDLGFMPDVRRVVNHSTMVPKGERQTLMFSATFPEEIQRLAAEFLDDYLFLTVGIVGSANADVEQTFHMIEQFEKRQKLVDTLNMLGTERTLVFVESKRTADFIASYLSQNKFPSTSIHGDRLQREREEALFDFRCGKMPILVATAVAARGLDIKDVRNVINYDLPKSIDEYVHRIGRTGRVGNLGKAISFYDPAVDKPLAKPLIGILQDAHQEVPDWLADDASSSYEPSGYSGRSGTFGARDVRKNKPTMHTNTSANNNSDLMWEPEANANSHANNTSAAWEGQSWKQEETWEEEGWD